MRPIAVPVLTDTELLTKVSSVMKSCVTPCQVTSAYNWGLNLVKAQGYEDILAGKVGFTLGFLADSKVKDLNNY